MSPELLGCIAALTLFTVAATIHAHRTRYSRPVVETTPTAGRGTNPRQCWTTGPRGGHAYASRVGGGWECMRCGDQVTP
jgi:hypothetical protein